MSCFWVTIVLCFIVSNANYAAEAKKFPSAVIVGAVYCDTCFHHYSPQFIEGATVAVECNATSPSFQKEVKTDKRGEFRVPLPLPISKHVKNIRECSVRLVRSSQPYCAVAAAASSSGLHLKSRKDGMHIFSAGFFTFKPLEQPQLCDQKPSVNYMRRKVKDPPLTSVPDEISFPPPIQDPPYDGGFLPPLPQLPPLPSLPQLPQLPPLPGIPFLPPKVQLPENVMYKPMDLPLPQTPPFGLSPGFPLPSTPPSSIQLPPVPGSIPSPPIPVPSFPSQPVPGFPGIPPAQESSMSRTSFP